MKCTILLCLVLCLWSCHRWGQKEDHQLIEVRKTDNPPTIDGKAKENCWAAAKWHALDQNWLGDAYSHEDFDGRFKLSWDEEALYILLEITDDSLVDQRRDPLKRYWDDDCVEIFVDEDNSGGLHQYSHNAFAYHLALDGNVVDLSPAREPRLYNDHVSSARVTEGKTTTWEIRVLLYDDSYTEDEEQDAVKLRRKKRIGFALAYCDNDGSPVRENFIGSVFVPGEDKNQGWINADIFGTLLLIE